jgi:hypothetical protein
MRKHGWAVKSPSKDGSTIHLAYDRHDTPEQAIQAYEELVGKSWEECVKEGAVLIQQEIVEKTKPTGKGNTSP